MFKFILLQILFLSQSLASDAAISLGERLFNDPRFSETFYANSNGDVNYPIPSNVKSCASCHMVDQEFTGTTGMRGYNDANALSPIPLRAYDNKTLTLRNVPTLIGIGSKYALNRFSHHDGEFSDHSQTVLGNFSGRNMGWLDHEKKSALKNIVNIIRDDNGQGELALEFGGSYERIFLGVDPLIADEFRLEASERLDVKKSSDEQIIEKVIFFVTTYMNDLDFEKDENEIYSGSMYDRFLKENNLPQIPKAEQDLFQYTQELVASIKSLQNPKFIKKELFENHNKSFGFNKLEWEGMKIFFGTHKQKEGMCIKCHLPPLFSDQSFHNIGSTQVEYDKIHGHGSFMRLDIPSTNKKMDKTLFASRPSKKDPEAIDLGMWNFFGKNRKLTTFVLERLCVKEGSCSEENILVKTIAQFKTPTLRNLGHTNPYLHNGSKEKLEQVLEHYIEASILIQIEQLRNGASELERMNFSRKDIAPLKAFLDSLNENYE